MKTCTKCKVEKPLTEFNKRASAKDGLQTQCRACHQAAGKKHYQANKQKYIETSLNQRKMLTEFVNEAKSDGCSRCDETRIWCLDFHHLDPTQKDLEVSTLIATCNKQRIQEEIEKCIILCKNCHADEHYQQRIGMV